MIDAAAEALARRILVVFPASMPRTRADVQRIQVPVGRLLGAELDARADRFGALPASPWLDAGAEGLAAARAPWREAVRAATRFPADVWEDAVAQAARLAVAHLVRPAETAAADAFADAGGMESLPVGAALARVRVFGAYGYLPEIAARYAERKGVAEIDRPGLERLLRRIDRRMVEDFGPDEWVALTGPLFDLLGPFAEPRETVGVGLLRLLFEAKGRHEIAQTLVSDAYSRGTLRAHLAAVLPRPAAPPPSLAAEPASTPEPDASTPPTATVPETPFVPELPHAPELEADALSDAPTPAVEAEPDGTGTDEAPIPAIEAAPLASTPETDAPPVEAPSAAVEAPPADEAPLARPTDDLLDVESVAEADPADEAEPLGEALEDAEAEAAVAEALVPEPDVEPERGATPPVPANPTPAAPYAATPYDAPPSTAPSAAPTGAPGTDAADALDDGSLNDAPPAAETAAPADEAESAGEAEPLWKRMLRGGEDAPLATTPDPDAPPAADLPVEALDDGPLAEASLAEPEPLWRRFAAPDAEPPAQPDDEDGWAVEPTLAAAPEVPDAPLPPPRTLADAFADPEDLATRQPAALPPPFAAPASSPPPSADARTADLDALERTVLGDGSADRRDGFVSALFGGSAEDYEATLRRLADAGTWTEATQIIASDVFRKHRVNIYSDPAVAFTDAVEARLDARS